MKRIEKSKQLGLLFKDLKKGKYSFDSPLQRKAGQWNKIQKSELIDSILRKDPISPVLIAELEDGNLDIIDGIQRISTINDYFNDEFALSRTLEPVSIDNNLYDIAGKKFSKLSEEVQDELSSYTLRMDIISKFTDEDIRRIFKRTNNGTPFKASQKLTVYESIQFSSLVYKISTHPFIVNNISVNNRIRDVDKDISRQILMLCGDTPINSFRANDIKKFIDSFEYDENLIDQIISSMDSLNERFENSPQINKTVFSYIVYGMVKSKNKEKYMNWVEKEVIDNFSDNEELKQYCMNGTANRENVIGRLEYFNNNIK